MIDIGPTLAHAAGRAFDGVEGQPLADLVGPGAQPCPRPALGRGQFQRSAGAGRGRRAAERRPAARARLRAFRGSASPNSPASRWSTTPAPCAGSGPGRHGIVGNVFFDRATGVRYLANDSSTWHHACDLLRPGVQTVFEACSGLATASVNEPIDRGAGYSTFELIRQAGAVRRGPEHAQRAAASAGDRHATQEFVAADPDYAWSTQVDAFGLDQVVRAARRPGRPAGPALVEHHAHRHRPPRRRPVLAEGPRGAAGCRSSPRRRARRA